MSARQITLEHAIQRIGYVRHGPVWTATIRKATEAIQARLVTKNTVATIENWENAQQAAQALRRPIELEILNKLGSGQEQAYWKSPEGGLLLIAPDHWNIFDFEANRDWPNATINGKSRTVYLDQSSLEIFIGTSPQKAPVTRYGRRAGEQWLISDVPIFEKMATEIDNGVKLSVAAKKYAAEAQGAGTEESKATRLRKAYKVWANGAE